MIGRELNHYRILEPLGKGGMGEVYLAEDAKLHRKIALKVLPSEMASDPERLSRFQREARAVAALNHPNIITIYSVEEDDGIHFITMELVEGGSLADRLAETGRMSPDELENVAVRLAEALAAAHAKGITHRDLTKALRSARLHRRSLSGPRRLGRGLPVARQGGGPPTRNLGRVSLVRSGALRPALSGKGAGPTWRPLGAPKESCLEECCSADLL